jgi:peptide/nickel transport system permease protein
MTKFIIRRLIQAIPTFFGITLLSYLIMVAAPGDPVSILSFDPQTSPQDRERFANRLGTNDPWPLQYLRWLVGDDFIKRDEVDWYEVQLEDGTVAWTEAFRLQPSTIEGEEGIYRLADRGQVKLREEPGQGTNVIGQITRQNPLELVGEYTEDIYGSSKGILRGDFGTSFVWRVSPLELIGERLPASIELNIAVIIVGLTLGILVGVLAAIRRGGIFDNFARVMSVIGNSIPDFWLGFLLLMLFASYLEVLPWGNRCGVTRGACPPIYDRLQYLVLPTAVLALGAIAGWSRFMRAAMLETIGSDFVRTARAKGLTNRVVWFRHAMRNALIPMATFLGPTFTGLLGGAVVIETIFAWPGVGRLFLQSISAQDYPIIMASVVLGSVATILGYLVSDILYAVFDPRIRY